MNQQLPWRHWLFFLLLTGLGIQKGQAQDTTLTIKAIAGLQYDLPRIVIRPGVQLRLKVDNYDDMAHNLVITRPGARERVVTAALNLGEAAARLQYVPRMPDVLAHTPMIEPGRSETITWQVPTQEGIYPYVCTYPGHGLIMYGVVYVTRRPENLPPLAEDKNLAAYAKNTGMHHHEVAAHPYPTRLPVLYRTFMPDCGPAAIAVGLPGNQSYCWDAGTCRLRYAWSGGFVDMNDHWTGKGNKLTHVVGDIYYRDGAGFPLRVGDQMGAAPVVHFQGYRLVERYPEFRYLVDGVEVRELIRPATNGRGLVRRFSVANATKPLSFVCKAGDGVRWQASAGTMKDGMLRLPAGVKTFTVTMLAE